MLVDAVLLARHDYLALFWRDMRQEDATAETRSQALQLSQAEGLDVLRHHPFFEVPSAWGTFCARCCHHFPAVALRVTSSQTHSLFPGGVGDRAGPRAGGD